MMQLRELRSNFYRTTRLLSLRKKTEYINNIQNRSDFAAKGRTEGELQIQARSKLVRCSEKRSSQRAKVYEYMKVTWALCLLNKMCCTCQSPRTVTGFSTCAGGGTLLLPSTRNLFATTEELLLRALLQICFGAWWAMSSFDFHSKLQTLICLGAWNSGCRESSRVYGAHFPDFSTAINLAWSNLWTNYSQDFKRDFTKAPI
jgi:hypothetical protein